MTYIIDPHIDAHIDKAVENAHQKFKKDVEVHTGLLYEKFEKRTDFIVEAVHQKFKKEMEQHTGLLLEKFQSDLAVMGETVDLKIYDTSRKIITEEVIPKLELIDNKINVFIDEIQVSKRDNKALRKEVKQHAVRITSLERATA